VQCRPGVHRADQGRRVTLLDSALAQDGARVSGQRFAQSRLNRRLAVGDSIAKAHVMRTMLVSALTRAMREELVSRMSPG